MERSEVERWLQNPVTVWMFQQLEDQFKVRQDIRNLGTDSLPKAQGRQEVFDTLNNLKDLADELV